MSRAIQVKNRRCLVSRIYLRTSLDEKIWVHWRDTSVIKKFPFLYIVKKKADDISCSCPISSCFELFSYECASLARRFKVQLMAMMNSI